MKFGTGLLSHVKVRADRHRSPILQTFVTVVAFRRIFASHPTLFSFSLFPSLLLSFPFVFPFSSHAFYRANSCCVSTLYNASVRLSVTSRYLYSYCIKIAECMITHKRRRSGILVFCRQGISWNSPRSRTQRQLGPICRWSRRKSATFIQSNYLSIKWWHCWWPWVTPTFLKPLSYVIARVFEHDDKLFADDLQLC